MVLANYSREKAVLYVDEKTGERLRDLFVWKSPENLVIGGPALTTLSSKQYKNGDMDMRVVFHYPLRDERSIYSWERMKDAEYLGVVDVTLREFGEDGLEKWVCDFKDQGIGDVTEDG